jgi:hypothetical protein
MLRGRNRYEEAMGKGGEVKEWLTSRDLETLNVLIKQTPRIATATPGTIL